MTYDDWETKVSNIILQDYDGYSYNFDEIDKYAKPLFERGLDIRTAALALLADHKAVMRAVETSIDGKTIH